MSDRRSRSAMAINFLAMRTERAISFTLKKQTSCFNFEEALA